MVYLTEKIIKPIEASTPNSSSDFTGNRIIVMEIISSVISMLLCP